mgnify:CR=1 FL=1
MGYSISLAGSGDLVKDGFDSASIAYKWLISQVDDPEGYIIEKDNDE